MLEQPPTNSRALLNSPHDQPDPPPDSSILPHMFIWQTDRSEHETRDRGVKKEFA